MSQFILKSAFPLSRRAKRRLRRDLRELIIFTGASIMAVATAGVLGYLGDGLRFYAVAAAGAFVGPLVWVVYRLARLVSGN